MGMSDRRRESFREFLLALEAKQNSQLISEEKGNQIKRVFCDGAVQVHNNESLHWVTSTSGILNEGYVCVYDSLSTGRLVPALRRQLADLYRTLSGKDGRIRVTVKAVQRQLMGKGNCGAFAIAFATSICHGIDPSTVAFSERPLRRHIHECLQSGKMTPFPHTRRHVPRGNEVQISISIYCTCYLHRPGKEMIQCDGCKNWFHVDCVCEPKNRAKIVQKPSWFCQDCSSRSK